MESNVYEANKYIKLGVKVWPLMFKDLIESRELIWRLFQRNLASKYKQAALGYFWVLMSPFVIIGSFVFLKKAGVVNIGTTDIPYPLFALIGLTVWQLFAVGITKGCASLVSAGNLLSKINFPREVLVFSSLANTLFEFVIKFILIILLFIFYNFKPSLGILLFPISLIPILLLTLGLSFILSLANAILRDIGNIVILLTTFLMFLTPVLYPPTQKNAFLFKLNPLSSLVSSPRELIVYGYIKEPFDFFISSVISVVIFLIAWRIFHVVQSKLPERI